jgi:hypothetical protein
MYLATIRRVRISVAALVPPDQGIRGTLAGGGTSRIVVNDRAGGFRPLTLTRSPETVVLTSASNASGVFELDLQPELRLPWEGCGLDIPFELRLPKSLNPFDYRTLADVQIGVDYTALYSPDYAVQAVQALPTRTSNSASFSLRDQPDAWYQLVTQAQQQVNAPSSAPLVAQFEITSGDFPPNLDELAVEQIALFVIRTGSIPAAFIVDHLRLNGTPTEPPTPTAATTVRDMVSTRNGSGAAWNGPGLIGRDPTGTWEVGLAADSAAVAAIARGDVQDLVLVLAYAGTLPAWPT